MAEPRIGVVGATGAVGTVTLDLLSEREASDVRAFASARSAGRRVPYRGSELTVEEATPEALGRGDLDLVFFSVGTDASKVLVPHALRGGARVVDKSDAFRLTDGVPLVVAGVNDSDAGTASLVANPNCSAIQLTAVLKPLYDAAGISRVRLATYQSASGAGDAGIEKLNALGPGEGDLAMDWTFDGEEFDEEWKLREESRKILGLPELRLSATCVRVPVLVGHAQAVWVETEQELSPDEARATLSGAANVALEDFPTPGAAAGRDHVLVGRIRRDPTDERTLALWIVNDNLRKGAALNAVQIADLMLAPAAAA